MKLLRTIRLDPSDKFVFDEAAEPGEWAVSGAVREQFRLLRPREGPKPARASSFLEVEGEDEEPGEQVDLLSIAQGENT